MTIPKIIWQTWKTPNLPFEVQYKINEMLLKNPEYEHRFLSTDEELNNFVLTEFKEFPRIINAYNKLNLIVARTDFWRYLALYKYGGVYLDIDSMICESLDKLIKEDDDAIITVESHPPCFVQWGLIFSKGHPILKKVIDLIVENIESNRYPNDILRMTGPRVFTESIQYNHNSLYGNFIDHSSIRKNTDITYGIKENNSSYRIYGIDYNIFLSFHYEEAALLYDNINNIKWTEELKQKSLLK